MHPFGLVRHGFEGGRHGGVGHGRMDDDGIDRATRKQSRDIIGRISGVGRAGVQRLLTPAVERHMHKGRLDDRSRVRIHMVMVGTMKAVFSGHSCPRLLTESFSNTPIITSIEVPANFSSLKLTQAQPGRGMASGFTKRRSTCYDLPFNAISLPDLPGTDRAAWPV